MKMKFNKFLLYLHAIATLKLHHWFHGANQLKGNNFVYKKKVRAVFGLENKSYKMYGC